MLIDTHCHLDAAEFDVDRAQCVAAAQQAGISQIVIPAIERANFATVAAVCREYPLCQPAFGIHPLYVQSAHVEDLEVLREILRTQNALAVGEIGLDYFVAERDEALQREYFLAQLKIARALDLPVILHGRRAIDAVLQCLRQVPVCGGIAHAFNGSPQQAAAFIQLGFKLGFGGAMSYARALRIRALAAELPLDALVLETDAPDLSPAWRHGQRNTPDQLAPLARVLAELRGIPREEVIRATSANAKQVFRGLTSA